MDCEDHVVPPVKFLEPYDSNQSAASLTPHENDAVHVQLTSGTSSSNREEERPPEPITGFGSRAGTFKFNNELRCIGFGGLNDRSPISINQESEDNIELLLRYPCTLCTPCTLPLSFQTTLTKRQKKKKCQMSVYRYHKADPDELIQ